jgi:hypothetical protein
MTAIKYFHLAIVYVDPICSGYLEIEEKKTMVPKLRFLYH